MTLAMILAALGAMAVNFGWQKADDGFEYLVQLEPETVQLLSEGVEVPIDSHVPEGVQPIRKVRIVVGKAELPRENLAATDVPRADDRVEHTTHFRPGEPSPSPDPRYAAQPGAPNQPSALDNIVQPIGDANDFVERGFQAGMEGLEKTGNAIRGTVNSATNTVQDQLQLAKETLVGTSPESTYRGVAPVGANPTGATAAPTGTVVPPAVASTPGWPNTVTAPTSASTGTIPNLPPPPLTGADTPVVSAPAASPPAPSAGSSGWDNRTSVPVTSVENGNRMVPIESTNTATNPLEAPPWKPNAWPPAQITPASSAEWITNSPSANTTAPSPATTIAQPAVTNGNPPTKPENRVVAEKPAGASLSESNGGNSLGSWVIALAVMVGSVGGNIFQFFNYLDIRNKYRAALRRTSRSFSRPAASA